MPPVFGHGRLRLYLLKLLAESPRHGYEVIRLLEERFHGLYAPSAGTVYPRLAKLASEGLVSHTEEGGRKVYSLTPEGERELAGRVEELAALERELRDSLAALAAGIREDVGDSARDLREEVRRAAAAAGGAEGGFEEFGPWQRRGPRGRRPGGRARWAAWQAGAADREETREAGETGDAEEEHAGHGPGGPGFPGGQEHFERAARRIQERVRSRATAGDWPGAVRAGLDGLGSEFGGWSGWAGPHDRWPGGWSPGPPGEAGEGATTEEREESAGAYAEEAAFTEGTAFAEDDASPVADPVRELERLLDRFRDDVRDAARDHGVSQEQLREARRHLSVTSAHLVALLRSPHG